LIPVYNAYAVWAQNADPPTQAKQAT